MPLTFPPGHCKCDRSSRVMHLLFIPITSSKDLAERFQFPCGTGEGDQGEGNRVSGLNFPPFFCKIANMAFLGWKPVGKSGHLGIGTLAVNMARVP